MLAYRLRRVVLAIASIFILRGTPLIAVPPAAAQTPTPPPCQSVKDALDKKLIKLTLTANGSLFFRDPLDYTIENTTKKTLDLCFPAGLIANPIDPDFQNLMLTATVLVSVGPGQTQSGKLFADCINESKHAPEAGAEYHLGSMAKGDLLGVAQAIEAKSAKNRLGAQMAIWAVTDKFTLDDLKSSSPDQMISAIRPLLCLTTGEVELAQELLVDAKTDIQLYTGENPLSAEYCNSQGMPTFDQIKQQLTRLGIGALISVGVGLVACVLVAGGLVYLVIRLVQRPAGAKTKK